MNIYSIFKQSIVIIIIVTVIVSCRTNETPSHTVDENTLRIDDKIYYYTIAVPYDFDETKSNSVLLSLHWRETVNFQSGISFLNTFILPSFKKFNGIIISPSCPESAGWIHENSESFIFTLLEKVQSEYNIDSTKIAVTGYSMGGIGTWYYAATFPEIFSLVIPVASMPPKYLLPITNINPTYVIHGKDDELFTLSNIKSLVREIKIKNNTIRLVEVDNASHYETDKYIEPLSESLDWIEDKWSD